MLQRLGSLVPKGFAASEGTLVLCGFRGTFLRTAVSRSSSSSLPRIASKNLHRAASSSSRADAGIVSTTSCWNAFGTYESKRAYSTAKSSSPALPELLTLSEARAEELWEEKVTALKQEILRLPQDVKWKVVLDKQKLVATERESGIVMALAECKVLCIFSKAQNSCELGWSVATNANKPIGITTEDVPESFKKIPLMFRANEQTATLAALALADAAKAKYIYIVPQSHSILFLGLFSLELGENVDQSIREYIEANRSPHEFVLQIMERIQTEISRLLDSLQSVEDVPEARNKMIQVLKMYAGSLDDAAPGAHVIIAKHLRQTALALRAEVGELTLAQDTSFPNRLRHLSAVITQLVQTWRDRVPKY